MKFNFKTLKYIEGYFLVSVVKNVLKLNLERMEGKIKHTYLKYFKLLKFLITYLVR